MLIQCQSCSTKYRLNLEPLPQRKTFVRCKACGTPIYIDPEPVAAPPAAAILSAEAVQSAHAVHASSFSPLPGFAAADGLSGAVLHPEGAGGAGFTMGMPAPVVPAAALDSVAVQCPACDSRYRVPAGPLQREGIKLKCTRCGHVFAPPRLSAGHEPDAGWRAVPEASPQDEVLADPSMPHFGDPLDGGDGLAARAEAMEPMQGMPDAEHASGLDPFPAPDAAEDPERAYLDAVSMDDEDAPPAGTPERLIPDHLKHQLFMDPQRFQGAGKPPSDASGQQGHGMAHETDGTGADSLPPLDLPPVEFTEDTSALPEAEAMPEAEEPPLDLPSEDGDLPSLEDLALEEALGEPETEAKAPPLSKPPKAGRAAKGDAAAGDDVPPLPMVILERPRPNPPGVTVEVPGQWTRLSEPRRFLLIGLAAAAVVAISVVWGTWLLRQPQLARAFVVESERDNLLALQPELETRYVVNQPSGRRLFIVQGTLENDFPSRRRISWVRVRGTLYADRGQTRTLGTAYGFLGNVLKPSELETMDLRTLLSYGAFNNGRGNENYHLLPQAKIPYQLVFPDVSDTVARTVVQVISYYRDGVSIFLDGPLRAN